MRGLYPEERVLLDVFLGAGLLYLLLWLPLDSFGLPMLGTLEVLSLVFLASRLFCKGTQGRSSRARLLLGGLMRRGLLSEPAGPNQDPWKARRRWISLAGVALLSLGVLFLESTVALTQPAGNTLDAANDTLFTATLLAHGHFTLNLLPYSNFPLFQPQGITLWFASAHLLLGLPLWTSVNLTAPLFQGLTILAAAALGRRWLGGEAAPVILAATFALLFSWPRLMVQDTSDFVASIPLALMVLPWLTSLFLDREPQPRTSTLPMVALLLLLDVTYSPIPAEALGVGLVGGSLTLLLGLRGQLRPRFRRISRNLAPLGIALVGVLPSLYLLATASRSLSTPGGHALLHPAEVPPILDPFLFGNSNIWVSPFPLLHYEFIGLFIFGLALLLSGRGGLRKGEISLTAGMILLPATGAAVLIAAMAFSGGGGILASTTNASELALFFILMEGLLGALALVLVVRWVGRAWPRARSSIRSPLPLAARGRALLPMGAALSILVLSLVIPLAVTTSEAPSYLKLELSEVSMVTPSDVSAMEYLGTQPLGPVLVAPGSAGEFLPAFVQDPVIYPLVGLGGGVGYVAQYTNGNLSISYSGPFSNATYQSVVTELTSGNLSSQFPRELAILSVHYILVTGESTTLFLPFDARALLADAGQYPVLYHSGDAYVFEVT